MRDKIEEIAVVGGLAAIFLCIYAFPPLDFYHA
jgi:hypothetical protein